MSNVIYGVDISRHQADNTVAQIAAGGKAEFVIYRRTVGTAKADEKFTRFAADVKKHGLKNGAYVASYAKNTAEAKAEADYLCDVFKSAGDSPELPLAYDFEYFSRDYIWDNFGVRATKELVQAMTTAFCERVKERGYTPAVYTNLDLYNRWYGAAFFAAHPDYKFWYARPGYSAPDKQCDIWQYASDNGIDFGYTGGNIDKNILMTGFVGDTHTRPMRPLSDSPARLYIGYASAGDIKALVSYITGLGIERQVQDGYITTGPASKGDQCYILTECNRLGVPCVLYEEKEAPGTETRPGDMPAEGESGGDTQPDSPETDGRDNPGDAYPPADTDGEGKDEKMRENAIRFLEMILSALKK